MNKLTEWSMIPACPSLMCFFLTGVVPKGLILQKKLCLMFVYVLFKCKFVSGLILRFMGNL